MRDGKRVVISVVLSVIFIVLAVSSVFMGVLPQRLFSDPMVAEEEFTITDTGIDIGDIEYSDDLAFAEEDEVFLTIEWDPTVEFGSHDEPLDLAFYLQSGEVILFSTDGEITYPDTMPETAHEFLDALNRAFKMGWCRCEKEGE